MVGRSRIVAVALGALAGLLPAADAGANGEAAFVGPPQIPGARSMGEQLAVAFDDLGAALDEHLGILTSDVLEVRFDGRHRRGRVRVRGATARVAVGFDSDVTFERGGAHVRARIDLRLGDHAVKLEIPAFEVRPTSVDGERGVEVRVPLITGTF